MALKLGQKAVDVTVYYEGFRSDPYLDSVGVPTIGYGTTVYPDGTKVSLDDSPVDKKQAEVYLRYHMEHVALPAMARYIKTIDRMTQDQIDAVASWTYNLGSGALADSTLRKKLNTSDFSGAADEFKRWVFAGGKKLKGLVRRRKSEEHLFRTGEVKFPE